MIRIFALLATLIPAMAAAQQAILVSESLDEHYSDRVQVSGKSLVGVILSGRREAPAGTALQTDSLSVRSSVLDGAPGLCVRARTQDGRYVATNVMRVRASGGSEDVLGVSWHTKYADKLNSMKLDEIAVLAFAGRCDDSVDILPVLMGPGALSGDFLVVVNTLGEAVTAALRDPETRTLIHRAKCTRVAGSARVAFDAVCDFGKIAALKGALPLMKLWLDQANDDGTQTETVQTAMIRISR